MCIFIHIISKCNSELAQSYMSEADNSQEKVSVYDKAEFRIKYIFKKINFCELFNLTYYFELEQLPLN